MKIENSLAQAEAVRAMVLYRLEGRPELDKCTLGGVKLRQESARKRAAGHGLPRAVLRGGSR